MKEEESDKLQVGVYVIQKGLFNYVNINLTPFKKAEKYLKYHRINSKNIIEQIEDGVSEVDLKGNGTFGNLANRRMLGIDDEDVESLGRNYRAYMDEETAKHVAHTYSEVYKTGIPGKNIVYDIIRKDGARRTVWASVSLIQDEEGRITGFRSVNRDITERQKAEKELDEHRFRLEAIFRSVKDAIITLDSELKVMLANDELEDICGISAKEITGMMFPQSLNLCSKSCCEVIKQTLEKGLTIREYQIQNMIGRSKKMQDVYRLLEDLANLETTVLITGESGTGKELVAKAIHYGGQRSFNPFIAVNCSALTESLLGSELFGHVKGAFTGAIHDKQGRFQAAHGGTMLLDESPFF